ncbi:substrate-binding domain-containing protein [Thermus filiformis]|uniref:ABC transporter substrate-binding protein n=1 Tax=Thermus filiformis TaxID=276 RepID=A0A0A2WWX7_THEFI|nr:substrate-binding domain-containing protein [Thermus filiformis]KGQ22785.1 ABC transporter substrate-binding protein [Thermus filiformis]
MRLLWVLLLLSPALALRLATTTSVYDSGLLDDLLPLFTQRTGVRVEVLAVGTGQALAIAKRKDADAALVHAPALEAQAIREGWVLEHACLAKNAFLLVGPPQDPARVRQAPDVLEALRRIARTQSPFVSRGDRSGTHLKEQELWQKAGVRPGGAWYLESGAGMGQTLRLAWEKGAYTLSDGATYQTVGKKLGLEALYTREDPLLLNQYSLLLVKGAKEEEARRLLDFLLSPEGQRRIGAFRGGLFQPLFGRCVLPVR